MTREAAPSDAAAILDAFPIAPPAAPPAATPTAPTGAALPGLAMLGDPGAACAGGVCAVPDAAS